MNAKLGAGFCRSRISVRGGANPDFALGSFGAELILPMVRAPGEFVPARGQPELEAVEAGESGSGFGEIVEAHAQLRLEPVAGVLSGLRELPVEFPDPASADLTREWLYSVSQGGLRAGRCARTRKCCKQPLSSERRGGRRRGTGPRRKLHCLSLS
ncbi:MAG: hypothetical protein OXI01_16130 [Albidovulum sp.]|nr:hypothetical protein [Albidovulum sp.]